MAPSHRAYLDNNPGLTVQGFVASGLDCVPSLDSALYNSISGAIMSPELVGAVCPNHPASDNPERIPNPNPRETAMTINTHARARGTGLVDCLANFKAIEAAMDPIDKRQLAVIGSDILTRCKFTDENEAEIRWDRKYTNEEKRGVRIMLLSRPNEQSGWRVDSDIFIPQPDSRKIPASSTTAADQMAARAKSAPAARPASVIKTAPLSPAELPQAMSYQYHVRSVGDKHIIARCDRFSDAWRVAKALGLHNVEVYQYRNVTDGYDDHVLLDWAVIR